VLGGEVVGAVDGFVAVGAQDGAVLHAEHQTPPLLQQKKLKIMSLSACSSSSTPVELIEAQLTGHLAHVAERASTGVAIVVGWVEERDAAVLPGQLVGAVDAPVAGRAERGLVSAAEHRGRLAAADVAVHSHGAGRSG
jgi:hypothetical protein